ncbi:ubiquitin carboxyl-terminal hydrolase 22/27/51 [Nematocida displodere]|uniref:Ubiquitin carboxyl-terminal hydrolase 22/27/51 n=1 Tax=Nematocida displodere TaxID=1805483 RepID=A0A177EKH7_9MICR|nr:ubiquitin carboxyl-terminal hydrolase 22/27/51 [Nematocida displodere]
MTCIHLDIEQAIEKCSGIIESLESLEERGTPMVCSACSDASSIEVCLDCLKLWCRCNGHVHSHWKATWHRNYFVPFVGSIACEECSEYIAVPEITRMLSGTAERLPPAFQYLNTHWVKGFLNLKRTCYMSSLLQTLLSLEVFLKNLFLLPHTLNTCSFSDCLICALSGIVYQMYNNEDTYVDISDLIRIFWKYASIFAESEYQDVQECFIYLGQQVHSQHPLLHSLVSTSDPDAGVQRCPCSIHKTFGGFLRSVLSCRHCTIAEVTIEPFTSISMDLLDKTLDGAILKYFQDEEMILERKCVCGTNEFVKKLSIFSMPEVLCIHLKRYEIRNKTISKVESVIKYPEELSIEGASFTLSSIIMHSGEIDSGHYIAYTKRHSQWYLTNDEEVVRVSRVDVLDKPAYILFYTMSLSTTPATTLAPYHHPSTTLPPP